MIADVIISVSGKNVFCKIKIICNACNLQGK